MKVTINSLSLESCLNPALFLYRYFTTKKTAYTFYGDGSEQQDEGGEGHEMKSVKNGAAPVSTSANGNGNGHDFEPDFSVAGTNGNATAAAQLPNPASNPFRKDATNNPFNQSNV